MIRYSKRQRACLSSNPSLAMRSICYGADRSGCPLVPALLLQYRYPVLVLSSWQSPSSVAPISLAKQPLSHRQPGQGGIRLQFHRTRPPAVAILWCWCSKACLGRAMTRSPEPSAHPRSPSKRKVGTHGSAIEKCPLCAKHSIVSKRHREKVPGKVEAGVG